jgi:hypothetical protein
MHCAHVRVLAEPRRPPCHHTIAPWGTSCRLHRYLKPSGLSGRITGDGCVVPEACTRSPCADAPAQTIPRASALAGRQGSRVHVSPGFTFHNKSTTAEHTTDSNAGSSTSWQQSYCVQHEQPPAAGREAADCRWPLNHHRLQKMLRCQHLLTLETQKTDPICPRQGHAASSTTSASQQTISAPWAANEQPCQQRVIASGHVTLADCGSLPLVPWCWTSTPSAPPAAATSSTPCSLGMCCSAAASAAAVSGMLLPSPERSTTHTCPAAAATARTYRKQGKQGQPRELSHTRMQLVHAGLPLRQGLLPFTCRPTLPNTKGTTAAPRSLMHTTSKGPLFLAQEAHA